MNSLRIRLFALVAAVTMLVWSGAAAWTSFSTRAEVEKVLDSRLVEAARMVAALNVPASAIAQSVPRTPYDRQLSCQIWSLRGELLSHSGGSPETPLASGKPGFSERAIGDAHWRVYTHVDPERGIRVMVGDNLIVRDKLISSMIMGLLLPAIVGLIALAILFWLSISRGLRPLDKLAQTIEVRSPDMLSPLGITNAPNELAPVVNAMDGLLSRLDAARRAERDFVANAAHELLTPLAGLKTQAEVARRASDGAMRDHALERITFSVDRTSRLVRQLLDLAREEGRVRSDPPPRAKLGIVLDEIAQTYEPLARTNGVTLHIETTCRNLLVAIEPEVLVLAIGNLVENAILHGASGGSVRISCAKDRELELRVADAGPGIAPKDRDRLRRRFERGDGTDAPGSGLGLSIVEAAIASVGGRLVLRCAEPSGLVATICIEPAHITQSD
ncbi:ATP-binding protein [Sphingobium sp. CCH11-B1]|jgi:two-component system sensor histidine kinase QseC|uniref:ATP-binding protein n=1 Tax=Sphingobium sp. CCH11-B1 TaxID=1768781 RepID=UPI0008317FBD|nr:ATP-binding protein [Sphingobium sp. CCH11-B1]MEA3389829.1 sensor histidine kinase N-terminal domain-containing protein [Pseudomonadota bacterium]